MATLHIEHPITDYSTWRAAFDRMAAARARAGVRTYSVKHPAEDERYIVVDLEFDTTAEASAFLRFLNDNVWASRESAPALAGKPQTAILLAAEPH